MGRLPRTQRTASATPVLQWGSAVLLLSSLLLANAEETTRTLEKRRALMGCCPPNGTLPSSVQSSLRWTSHPVSPSANTSTRVFSNTGRRALIPLSYARIPALAPLSGLATGVTNVPAAFPAVSAAPATAVYSTGIAPTAASMTTALDPRTSWEASTGGGAARSRYGLNPQRLKRTFNREARFQDMDYAIRAAQLSSRNAVLQDRIVAAALAAQAAGGAANSGATTVQGPVSPVTLSLPTAGQATTPQVAAPVMGALQPAAGSMLTAPATAAISTGVAPLTAAAAVPSAMVSHVPAPLSVAATADASLPIASTTTVVTPAPIVVPSLAVSANPIPTTPIAAPATAASTTYSASLPVVAPVSPVPIGQQETAAELESDTVVVKHQPTVYKPPPTVVQPPPTVIHHPPTVVEHPSTVIEPAATIISSKHTASHTGTAVVHSQGEQASVYSAGAPAVATGGTAPSLVSTGAAQLQAVGGVSAYSIPSARSSSTVNQKIVSSTAVNPVVASGAPVMPVASAVTQPLGLSTLGGSGFGAIGN